MTPKKKPAKKRSSTRVAKIAGKYLEMSQNDFYILISPFYLDHTSRILADLKILAASVLSQKEK